MWPFLQCFFQDVCAEITNNEFSDITSSSINDETQPKINSPRNQEKVINRVEEDWQ